MSRRFVVEADGGSRGNPGPAAYGAVVRDAESGEVLRELAEHIGTASNNVAEYRGLIAGLQAVRELDPERHGRGPAGLQARRRADVRPVEDQAPRHAAARAARPARCCRRRQVTYTWVPREQNKHADRLANEALDAAARGEAWSPADSTAELRSQDATAAGADAAVGGTAAHRLVGWDAELGAPTTTVLLRHGETPHTAEKRFSGAGGQDPELSEAGLPSGGGRGRPARGHRRCGRRPRLADAPHPADC